MSQDFQAFPDRRLPGIDPYGQQLAADFALHSTVDTTWHLGATEVAAQRAQTLWLPGEAGKLTKIVGIDPEVMARYVAVNPDVFRIGLPGADADNTQLISNGRKLTAEQVALDYEAISKGVFALPGRSMPGPTKIESPGFGDIYEKVLDEYRRDTSVFGVFRSNPLHGAIRPVYLLYAHRMLNSPLDTPSGYELVPVDAEALGRSGAQGNVHLTQPELTQAFADARLLDMSQESLDARVQAFLDLAPVELLGQALRELREMGLYGNARAAAARAIFRRYEKQIRNGSIETPFDMLVDISYACADFAERAGHTKMPRHEALFTQLSSRAMSIVATFKTTLDTLAAISQSDGGRALPALRKAMDSLATRMPPEIVEAERIARESKLAKVEYAQTTEVPAEVDEGDLAVGGLGEFAPEVRRARQIAEQLDEIILPTSREGLDHEEFKRRLRQVADDAAREAGPGASGKIAWLRLGDLAALCDVFDGRLFRSKPQSLGGGPPYFVCMFTYRGTRYGVAESPVVGNATYTVSEFHSAMSVLDVLTLTRAEARRFNAERRTHRPTLPYGPERVDELAYAVMQMAEEEAAGQRRPIAIPRGYRLVNDANATR